MRKKLRTNCKKCVNKHGTYENVSRVNNFATEARAQVCSSDFHSNDADTAAGIDALQAKSYGP